MAAKKSKKKDWRDIVIVFLLFAVGVQFYFLYQSNESLRNFVSSSHSQQGHASAKKSRPIAEQSHLAPTTDEDRSAGVSVVPVKPSAKKVSTAPLKKSYVALVIDDWGYSTRNCQYLQSIKEPITVAVLPSLPHTDDVMACAHKAGKEIVLHLPMEAHNNSDEYPPDYLLKTDMSPLKIDRLLSDTLDKMPLISGVNNHMGSKATEDKMVMTTVFKQLKHRGLFYIDSKVTPKSVCEPLARQANLPFASRDVFLDNVNEEAPIEKELETLTRLAKKHGKAIAIGHDRVLTMQTIEKYLPVFKEQGIELVTVKEYIKIP